MRASGSECSSPSATAGLDEWSSRGTRRRVPGQNPAYSPLTARFRVRHPAGRRREIAHARRAPAHPARARNRGYAGTLIQHVQQHPTVRAQDALVIFVSDDGPVALSAQYAASGLLSRLQAGRALHAHTPPRAEPLQAAYTAYEVLRGAALVAASGGPREQSDSRQTLCRGLRARRLLRRSSRHPRALRSKPSRRAACPVGWSGVPREGAQCGSAREAGQGQVQRSRYARSATGRLERASWRRLRAGPSHLRTG